MKEIRPEIIIDPIFNWNVHEQNDTVIYHIGRDKTIQSLNALFIKNRLDDLEGLTCKLKDLVGNFAAIFDSKLYTIAIVDKIRSYPIYYSKKGKKFRISNSARKLKESCGHIDIEALSLLELQMAVYVTGENTIYKNLYQLQAGEILIWNKSDFILNKKRYFLFYSKNVIKDNRKELIKELGRRTDLIFKRIVNESKGKNIWVPLSGGLDSRLVLCKLKEHGVKRLNAFSWGVPKNREALTAKRVAQHLRVPWIFVSNTIKNTKEFFYSKIRKQYWEYADGLHVVPNLNQLPALLYLKEQGKIKPGDVVINGQSGDFISGAHIPILDDMNYDKNVLFKKIILKHYKHRKDLLNDVNISLMMKRIDKLINENSKSFISDEQEFAKQYELWEWQERQVKRVVNGQRNYDFLGLSWLLPLWEHEYLDFWSRVPVKHKINRNLFVEYLENEDFYGLFRSFKARLSRWPGRLIIIQYFGNLIKLIMGPKISNRYYEFLDYFSQYAFLYSHLSFYDYLKLLNTHKGPLSMYSQRWIEENVS